MDIDNPNKEITMTSDTSTLSVSNKNFTPKWKLPIILGVLILLLLAGSEAYYFGMQNSKKALVLQQNNPSPAVKTHLQSINKFLSPTIDLSTENSEQIPPPLIKQANTHIDMSGWQTYRDSILDITFKYPPSWKIKTGDYFGSLFLVAPDVVCQYITDWLKNPQNCNDKTIRSFSPGLTIVPPKPQNAPDLFVDQLQFIGPTSGIGGGCDSCSTTIWDMTINGKPYALNTVTIPPDPKVYPYHGLLYTTLEPLEVNIPTGNKSIWKYFNLYLEASNQEILDTETAILQSISF